MRKRLLLLVVGLVLAFPMPVSAGVQGFCGTDHSFVILFENAIGDKSDNDDRLHICNASSNLNNISHTLPGGCNGGQAIGSWNDCASSWQLFLPTNQYVACIYRYQDYFTLLQARVGPKGGQRYDIPSDQASSVRILFWQTGAESDDCLA
jgi:hypothetical protein